MYVELSPRDLNPDFYSPHPTPYKYLYLWNDHRTKDV